MVEAFAMIAGTALEYGDRMLACLDKAQTEAKSSHLVFCFSFSVAAQNHWLLFPTQGWGIIQNVPAATDGRWAEFVCCFFLSKGSRFSF